MATDEKEMQEPSAPSSLGFRKYPTDRDGVFRTATHWINGKRIDDDVGELWRVHNKLYDLSQFIKRHPGGSYWLEVTKGTDITEAFECHHLTGNAEKILEKYFVREAVTPRNSPYTFDENGFYKTLKRRVAAELPKVPPQKGTFRAHNILLISYTITFITAALLNWTWLAIFAGVLLGMLMNCSHNYFHQKDNWRMYAWDLSGLSSAEWRITHSMSHHGFANTIYDYELSSFEPVFDFKVKSKNFAQRFLVPATSFVFYLVYNHKAIFDRTYMVITGRQKLRPENLLPLVELILLIVIADDVSKGLRLWNILMMSCSFYFAFIGIIAAHHHPNLFHEGDPPKYGMDWGLCQLDAVGDRWDVNWSDFLVATMYGEHSMHHLFPTVDHDKLPYLRHLLVQTAKEFGVKDIRERLNYNQIDLWIGMYRQLMRVTPRVFKSD